ncbi:MAG: hypothetical protein COA94_09215 [Rickettsiales bacterium]|nr:MAG: hypothetical protein COA94_09215 [Rickettsiales bacterium]
MSLPENIKNFSLYPLNDEDKVRYDYYQKQLSSFWTSDEIDFTSDADDFLGLDEDIKTLVKNVLSFFTVIDGIVIDGIFKTLLIGSVSLADMMFYTAQLNIESVHVVVYAKALRDIIPKDLGDAILSNLDTMESIKRKTDWIDAHVSSGASREHMLVVFSCVEGIFLMSPIMMIYRLASLGIFKGLSFANEQISKDEQLHSEYAEYNYSVSKKIPDEDVIKIVSECVELELLTLSDILPKTSGVFHPKDFVDFIKHLGNIKLKGHGIDPIWDVEVENLASWVGSVSMTRKSNFHETKVGNYSTFSLKDDKPNVDVNVGYMLRDF